MNVTRNSFFEPQRQSKTGIVLLILYNFGVTIKNLWVVIVIFLIRREIVNIWSIIISVSIFLLLLISAILQYFHFKYFIDDENREFVIQEGIINRSVTKIKIENIQEVNISQPFIHRLFNIYKLDIDTPGSTDKEVKISALSKQNAIDLKAYLLTEKINLEKEIDKDNIIIEHQEDSKIFISTFDILNYGITANYLQSFLALISLILYGISQFDRFLSKAKIDNEFSYDYIKTQVLAFSIPVFFIVPVVVFIIAVLVNAVRTLIKFYNFKVTENNHNFSFEYGLLSTRNSIVNTSKVQVIVETQNWIQKKLNISYLKFLQIGKLDTDSKKNVAAIPGIKNTEKEKLISTIWQENPSFENQLKPNFRLLFVNALQFIIIPVFLFFIVKKEWFLNYWFIVFFYVLITSGLIIISYQNLKLFYNEKFVRMKSGIWDIDNRTFEVEKLQTVKISQYFWQRKTNLGSITFYTSAGSFKMVALDFKILKKLLNYCIYKIETSKKN